MNEDAGIGTLIQWFLFMCLIGVINHLYWRTTGKDL